MTHSVDDNAPEFNGPCTRPELAGALPRWDRLGTAERAKLEGHSAGCPSCGPALALLREAQDYLVARTPARLAGPCPDAEDLYEFGRGPGARPMLADRRAAIEEHLGQCVECEAFAGTLATKPPSPLILDAEPRTGSPATQTAHAPRGEILRRPPRLRALAAAAVLLSASFLAWRELQAAGPGAWTAQDFPAAELMRGADAGRLLWPRDRVLPALPTMPDQTGQAALPTGGGPRFGSGLVFELSTEVRGESYRIRVDRHDGGAFDPGTLVFELSAGTPLLRPSAQQLALLAPGDYTWEAWARIDGLDVQLGRRDFHVLEDEALATALAQLDDRPRLERLRGQLTLLWEHGYRADARALARALPDSPARDEFLDRAPEL